jgi:hypothetical protein
VGAPEQTVKRARRLRKEMSLPEVLLWRELQKRPGGFKFRKQFPQGGFAVLSNLEGVLSMIVAHCEAVGPLHHRPAAGGSPPRPGEDL